VLTCNSNFFAITTAPSGWTFSSPGVYGYAYNTPNGSNLGLGNGPYDNIAILLNENASYIASDISTAVSGLTAGQQYDLSFQYWGDNVPTSDGGQTYSFNVNVNGGTTLFANVVNSGLGSGNFNTANISFVATGSTADLTFTQLTPLYGGGQASPIIDNISINPTPEPGFYGILALGLAGLAAAFRRRKNA
jgi:MYXO-CTERM domain-containing protein